MRNLLCVLILLSFVESLTLSCHAPLATPRKIEKRLTDLANYNLQGKVQSLNILRSELSANATDSSTGNIKSARYITFNRQGYKEKSTDINKRNAYSLREHFSYDPEYNITRIRYYELNYTKASYSDSIVYDKWGNKVEDLRYDMHDSISSRTRYTTDFSNNSIKHERTEPNGILISREVEVYDITGKIIEHRSYDHENKLSSTNYYVYNKKGELIKNTSHYTWSPQPSIYVYKYNEQGNVVEETDLEDENQVVKYKYSAFDKHGNWTKLYIYRFGKPIIMDERTFSYF